MALQIRRGTEAQRAVLTGVDGELLYTTDTKKLYVGDGVTAGGTEVAGAEAIDLTAPGAIGSVTASTGDFTTIGATTPGTGDFTNLDSTVLTASTSLDIGSTIAVTGVLDEDTMSSDSAVKLATQQSIKAYVDALPASQAEQETGTSVVKSVTPGRQHHHVSAAKGWVNFNAQGTLSIKASYNIASITDQGVGDFKIYWATDFSGFSAYTVVSAQGNVGGSASFNSLHPGTTVMRVLDAANGALDSIENLVVAFGDQ